MAELSNLDLILQREEHATRDRISHSKREIEYLLEEVDRHNRVVTKNTNLNRELLEAMAARNVPPLDS